MAMGRRKKRIRQEGLWIPTAVLPVGASHPFYQRLNQILDEQKFDEYVAKLHAKGVRVGAVMNHDNSPRQVSAEVTPDVWVRSVYFWDPDGVMLEFASWTHKGFTEADVAHEAVDAAGEKSRAVVLGKLEPAE